MSAETGSSRKGNEWSLDATQKLIKELEVRPCLWRKEDKHYKNKYIRAAALDNIAVAIGIHSESVKDKIRSLRTIFMQVNKKKEKSGSAGGSQPPKWEHFKALEFLAGEVAQAGEVDSIERGEEENDTILSEVRGRQTIRQEVSTDTSGSTELMDVQSSASIAEQPRKRKKNIDLLAEERLNLWQNLNKALTSEKSENSIFADSISSSLNLITGRQLQIKTKSRIQLILSEALAEQARSNLNEIDVELPNTSRLHPMRNTPAAPNWNCAPPPLSARSYMDLTNTTRVSPSMLEESHYEIFTPNH